MSTSLAELREPLARAWACRWTFAVPIATILLPVTFLVFSLPDIYEATAVVRVRELNMGRDGQLPGERQARAGAIVATTAAELLAVENLEATARVLVPDMDPSAPLTHKEVRERTRFKGQGTVGFSVSIDDTDPHRAAEAVNVLLQTFFARVARGPIERAEDRRAFRNEQLLAVKKKHKEASDALADFREKNRETLPEAQAGIQNELATVRTELAIWDQMASVARNRIEFLDQELARTRLQRGPNGAPVPARPGDDAQRQRLETLLQQLETQKLETERSLRVERTTHKDKHPNIVALLESLKAINADIEDTRKGLAALDGSEPLPAPAPPNGGDEPKNDEPGSEADTGASADRDPLVSYLRRMHRRAGDDRARAESNAKRLRERREELQALAARIPFTERELLALVETFEEADDRLDAADQALSEATELVEFLKFSDAADVSPYVIQQEALPPAEPKGPRRVFFMAAGLGAGVGLGYGLLLLRRRFRLYSVTSRRDLAEFAGAAMVVSVPMLPDGRRSWKQVALPLRELVLGGWVLFCLSIALLIIAGHYGLMEAPAWLGNLMGRSS